MSPVYEICHVLDLVLLWLWCRPAAVASIRLLAWELLYAAGAALKKEKKKRKNQMFPRAKELFKKISTLFHSWIMLHD